MEQKDGYIDYMLGFSTQKSFRLGIFNGTINVSELILSGKARILLKDDKNKTFKIFNVPIEKKLIQTNDTVEILYIGGIFKHTFQKKTKMKEIHIKLDKHLVSVGKFEMTFLKGKKFTLNIEPKKALLVLS